MSAVDMTPLTSNPPGLTSTDTQNPQTDPSQLPGQQFVTTPAGATPANPQNATPAVPQVDTTPLFTLPTSQQLPAAMAFPVAASGPQIDSQYLAQEAAMRYDIAKQYQGLLQQLGYTDPTSGQAIQGQIALNANIKQAQLQHDLAMEALQNSQQMQQQGTIFSGINAQQLAQLQYPTVQQEGQLNLDTTQAMQQAYQQAQDLITQYNLQNNQLLADAANRYLQNQLNRPSGAGGGGDTTTNNPPPDTTTNNNPPPPSAPSTPPVTTVGAGQQAQTAQAAGTGGAPAPIFHPSGGPAAAFGEGGIVDKPTEAVVGEKGPEVIIPLRKLSSKGQIALLRLADQAGIYEEAIKQMAGSK